MPVIPFPQRHRDGEPAPGRPRNRGARIHGTFRSPNGGLGTMTGWLRLERVHVVSDRLCAAGVFTGELLDSDGTSIGVGSRRRTVPAEIALSLHGMAVVIGPVDVDLLGLTVNIPAFTMDTGVVGRPVHADAQPVVRVDADAWPARAPEGGGLLPVAAG